MLADNASTSRVVVDRPRSTRRSLVQKVSFRAFDLSFTMAFLPIVLPAILLSAAAIKISDPKHPAFFKQTRYGIDGKPFKIIKLRTMVPNAEALKAELLALSEDKGQGFKIDNDPRITTIGRILRRSYFDELPQFFNVLVGHMSIVGPRANSFHPSTYEPWQLLRLQVKPGLTGDWQVSRDKTYDFRERCRMDNDYVLRKSLWRDVKIIAKTVKVCLFERNGK